MHLQSNFLCKNKVCQSMSALCVNVCVQHAPGMSHEGPGSVMSPLCSEEGKQRLAAGITDARSPTDTQTE